MLSGLTYALWAYICVCVSTTRVFCMVAAPVGQHNTPGFALLGSVTFNQAGVTSPGTTLHHLMICSFNLSVSFDQQDRPSHAFCYSMGTSPLVAPCGDPKVM